MKVWVVAPDRPSGDEFDRVLRANGIKTEIDYPKIAARVVGDRISEDEQVAIDLQTAVDAAREKKVVIACNTFSRRCCRWESRNYKA